MLAAPALAAMLSLAPSAPAQADTCTKYASPTGSDTQAGTLASPYRSANKLAASLSAGQTGCLRGGDYTDGGSGYALSFSRSGAAGSPISIVSYPGERARLLGIITVSSSISNVRIANVDIEGTGGSNTIKIYGTDVVIENNDITNKMRGNSCMIIGSSSGGRATRTIIRRNFFHDCGATAHDNKDHSIYAAMSDDGQIVDNVFSNVAGKTIQLYPDAQRNYVAHNVIDGGADSVRGGIVIGGGPSSASNDNVVERNVITYAATYNVYSNWEGPTGSRNVVRDNCLYGARSGDIDDNGGLVVGSNPHADPRFVNRAARDYRLADTSPCLSVVGYDTAALLAGGTAPAPAPTPAPTASPSPTPSPVAEPAPADTTPPVVSWATPISGQVLRGGLTEVAGNCAVNATDATGVVRVDFEVDGVPLNSDSFAPWNCVWDTSTVADGPHVLKATARDPWGNVSAATVTVTVDNSTAQVVNEAPWVELVKPVSGTIIRDSLSMAATAGDDKSVVKVDFYLDGVRVATDDAAPYETTARVPRNTKRNVENVVAAKAYDAEGLTSTSTTTVTRTK